ncbi:unnamed protein product [Heligmosomoides polygyrus]|uniref:Uncharacterized protein n=1 Tax=Heligmosomoides polygyrus TaxID=6339 RepID=A0A183FEL9_HELPZ|nr:unnamed protein product [Heligmosomoides polygyrus]
MHMDWSRLDKRPVTASKLGWTIRYSTAHLNLNHLWIALEPLVLRSAASTRKVPAVAGSCCPVCIGTNTTGAVGSGTIWTARTRKPAHDRFRKRRRRRQQQGAKLWPTAAAATANDYDEGRSVNEFLDGKSSSSSPTLVQQQQQQRRVKLVAKNDLWRQW